jgi:hypothetical protein
MTVVIERKIVYVALAVAAIAAAACGVWHLATHGRTVIGQERLVAIDPQNAGINIRVWQPWLEDSVLVFDVGEAGDRDFNRIDVTRCLLQCAQDLQQSDAARVYLANRGNRVYYIAGNDFRNLGNHYKKGDDWNNAWVLTSIPAVTHTLNDSLAFAPTTGWLSTVDDATNWNTMMSNLLD